MHFIAQLYIDQKEILRQENRAINIRGYYASAWVAPELSDIKLPVNAIAYNLCPTARDLYFERVKKRRSPATWERYVGKVIDSTYKDIHRKCERYVIDNSHQFKSDLYHYILRGCKKIIESSKRKFASDLDEIEGKPDRNKIRALDINLKKIVKSEARIASNVIEFELCKTEDADVKGIFHELLFFNTNLALKSLHVGFGEKATPDFLYRHEIIGDIKSGKWQEFYLYTAVAYALAYEEHMGRNMDYGAILSVQLSQDKPEPVYTHSKIVFIDDRLRNKFLAIRDRKLQIIKAGVDPGKPDSKAKCDASCPYLGECWNKS